jgi:adenylylsulfate kinase
MGLPGSGKSTLAEPFAKLINGVWLNADQIRKEYDDWDFSPEGRLRQSTRMRYLADGVIKADKIAVADFVCPTESTRAAFDPDYIIWMDTIQKSRFSDTNMIFEIPKKVDYHVSRWFDDTHIQLFHVITSYLKSEK